MLETRVIEDCLAYYAMEKGHSTRTQLINRQVLERFQFWIGKKHPHVSEKSLKEEHFTQYLQDQIRGRDLKPASQKLELVAIRNYCRYLVNENILEVDLASRLTIPKLPSKLPETLTVKEVDQILQAPWEMDPLGLRNKAILEFFYATGARVSEVTGARLELLDLTERTIRVIGKGNKQRLVLLGQSAIDTIKEYLAQGRPHLVKAKTGGEVFLAQHGGALTRHQLLNIVKEAVIRAGIHKNVYPHLLRHSFATHMLAHGADLRVIQELLGHANINTTEIYTHVDQDRIRSIHQKFHPRSGK